MNDATAFDLEKFRLQFVGLDHSQRLKFVDVLAQKLAQLLDSPEVLFGIADRLFEQAAVLTGGRVDEASAHYYWRKKANILELLSSGSEITSQDREWLVAHLKGRYDELEKASANGIGNNRLFLEFVIGLSCSFGFPKFRNDVSYPSSAIDVAAKLNNIRGDGPTSYSRIKAIVSTNSHKP